MLRLDLCHFGLLMLIVREMSRKKMVAGLGVCAKGFAVGAKQQESGARSVAVQKDYLNYSKSTLYKYLLFMKVKISPPRKL